MTLVFDPNDPLGMGMFSKAGRVTSAKYTVFQKRSEIMENKQKFLKVTSLPVLGIDLDLNNAPVKPLLDDNYDNTRHSPTVQKKAIIPPFSQQLSRELIETLKGNKHPPPPTGFYNPKYNCIHKSNGILFNYNKERQRPVSSGRPSSAFDETEASKPLPDKPKKKVNGPGPFGLQTARDRFFRPENDPHEERFTLQEYPKSFSKTRRVASISMRKSIGRDSSLSSSGAYHPDYDPNYEFGRKQLGTSGPRFEKRTGRQSVEHVSWSTNDNFFDTSKNLDLKFRRTKDLNFTKDLPREIDPDSPLPSFMQRGNSSRQSIRVVNAKSFKIGNFSEARFPLNQSIFSPNSTYRQESNRNTGRG